jgi:drug/metabolite transporter (DMT)-like permease
MSLKMFGLLLVALGIGAAGQVFLKLGLTRHGQINGLGSLLLAMVQKEVVCGLLLYVLSSMLYLVLMSRLMLSVLYPMVALNYVFVTILSWYFFQDHVNGLRIAGLAVIIAGVTLVGFSQTKSDPAETPVAVGQGAR